MIDSELNQDVWFQSPVTSLLDLQIWVLEDSQQLVN